MNQFALNEKYASSDIDCALIELPYFSKELWSTWKNVFSGIIPIQLITTEKTRRNGVSFNTALGIGSSLGAMPIGESGNLQNSEDLDRDGCPQRREETRSSGSAVCDADGMLIGYPPPRICSGERLDDAAFESILRIILDGLIHHYGKSVKLPKKLGIIRDGQFFENPYIITKIEKEYSVSFVIVDVKKQGAPKLAVENGLDFKSAKCGTVEFGNKSDIYKPQETTGHTCA